MNGFKDIIEEISRINKVAGTPDLTRPVVNLLESHDKTIYITVLGQFKSGKSSLINSIIGENILPVGVVPVTAIVTRLCYGPQKKMIIRFSDGREFKTTIDKLPLYVTEKLNPQNTRMVSQVIIEEPIMELFKNISFVDTPGLGSFYRHNTETTMQWLPFTGVAIINISTERPLADEDLYLIKGIAQYCPDIVLILTKTDLFGAKELEEIKLYISESVNKALNKDIPIFEYSVYKNSQEYRDSIIKELIIPLNNNSEKKLSEITRHKTKTIIEQSLQYTELALQASMKQKEEKDSISKLLQEIKNNRQYHEREMLLSGSSFKGEIRNKLEKYILPYYSDIKGNLSEQLSNSYIQWYGVLPSVTKKFELWLKEKLSVEITELDNNCFEEINNVVKEIVDYYQYSALQFRQRLNEKINLAFGANLPETYWQIDFTGIDKPDVSIYRVFDSHLDLLLFFLPMKFFRGIFFKHFYNQIPLETEKNLHRYISDLTGKIVKATDNIHKQASLYISNEIKTVENVLQNVKDDYIALQKNIARLKEFKSFSTIIY